MKNIITMTLSEYDSQREKLREEVTNELESRFYRFPFIMFVSYLIGFGWLFSKILEGYDLFPRLTLFTICIGGIFYIFGIWYLYQSIKKHYENIYIDK